MMADFCHFTSSSFEGAKKSAIISREIETRVIRKYQHFSLANWGIENYGKQTQYFKAVHSCVRNTSN